MRRSARSLSVESASVNGVGNRELRGLHLIRDQEKNSPHLSTWNSAVLRFGNGTADRPRARFTEHVNSIRFYGAQASNQPPPGAVTERTSVPFAGSGGANGPPSKMFGTENDP
jgi:hypothetical protein